MVTALRNHLQNVDTSPIPLIGFKPSGQEEPPVTEEFRRRIEEIARGRMSITTGVTRLNKVTPHDFELLGV